MGKQQEYNASVIFRDDINPFLMVLGILPDVQPYTFKAGQYTVLGLKGREPRVAGSDPDQKPKEPNQIIQRAYSIASSNKSDQLEFYLALVNTGELTPRLFSLHDGDRVYISPKCTGLFTLDRIPAQKHLLLMSTGTGLAPYISMLRSQVDSLKNRKVVILHGVRNSTDLGYRKELEELEKKYPNIFYMPVISRPANDPSWKGLSGYLQDVLFSGAVEEKTKLKITPDHFDALICGNPGMIASTIEKLNVAGFVLSKGRTIGTIHIEEYW